MISHTINNIFIVLRAKQWVKNLLLFLPFVASGSQITLDVVQRALIGFILFSAVSSFGYFLNDLKDRELDALHPQKKFRVQASASFTKSQLLLIYGVLLVITFSTSVIFLGSLNSQFFFIIVTYFIMNGAN
jgi:4-hydroxybenzoate polyprenyltransferase